MQCPSVDLNCPVSFSGVHGFSFEVKAPEGAGLVKNQTASKAEGLKGRNSVFNGFPACVPVEHRRNVCVGQGALKFDNPSGWHSCTNTRVVGLGLEVTFSIDLGHDFKFLCKLV